MPDTFNSHPQTPGAEDAQLAQASRSRVAQNGPLQLIAEIVEKLRGSHFAWWTPGELRTTWSAPQRMDWFAERPDIRQRITCNLTGLRPKAARNKTPDFQAALIDSVVDDGDVTVAEFENEFDAIELAAHAPVALIWQQLRGRLPWDEDTAPNQELVAWLIERLLADSSVIDGMTRQPILSPHALRTTIPGKLWHSRIPLDVRVAIDELRLELERENAGEPFHAVHDLSVATPAVIAANIPLRELLCVLDAAERAMGLPPAREWAPPARTRLPAEPKKAELQAPPAPVSAQEKPAVLPAEKAPEKPLQPARAETPVDAKGQPSAPALERAPGKPVEKSGEKSMDRWERMASKAWEKLDKETSTAEEHSNTAKK